MKSGAVLLCLLATSWAFAQAPIQYEVAFPNVDHCEAEITAIFPDVADSVLKVRMSRTSPGRYALHEFAKNVYNVRAVDSKGRLLKVARPNLHQWNVSGHDGTVDFSYTIFGDRCDGTYLAVDNTHAHLNAPATFVWARGLETRAIQITFKKPHPDWQIATQLAPTNDPEVFTAPNLQYFMDSPVEISDFVQHAWQVNTDGAFETVRLALHHDGTNAEAEAYARMCQAVVAEEIAIFRAAPSFDYGVYTFIADYLPYVSGDGMEHRNSTILTSRRSLAEHAVRNLGTVAHEFFHAWNVERMRPRSLEPFDFEQANVSGELWFAEGFTSYYDALVLKRAQITSLDRFAEELGRTLDEVFNAPGRQFRSLVEMSQHAPFVDAATSVDVRNFDNTFVSYYTFGAAVGLGLDLTLRQQFPGLSLDDFMRAVWQRHGQTKIPYSNADLQEILAEITQNEAFARSFFEQYIDGREILHYESLLAPAGFLLRKAARGKPWLGRTNFEHEDGELVVHGVTLIGSPLYQAGVDNGDIILSVAGRSIVSEDDIHDLLSEFEPGDSLEIVFEKNGRIRNEMLVLEEDPELEVTPFEHAGIPVTEEISMFRQAWLGSQSEFDHSSLKKFCPQCARAFAFEYEFCHFDGEGLKITPQN